MYYSFLVFTKCIEEKITASYMDFPKEYCTNVTSPCWIPHVNSIIHQDIVHALPQCDTIEKYSCMLKAIDHAPKCLRSCKAESYTAMTSRNTIEPFLKVSWHFKFTSLI